MPSFNSFRVVSSFILLLTVSLFPTPILSAGVRLPNADTPVFYLVASLSQATPPASAHQGANLRPLRLSGGTAGYSTLSSTSTAPIGQFYFSSGQLYARDPNNPGPVYNNPPFATPYRPNIGAILGSTGCSTYGQLGWVQGSSSNKCARYNGFQIQSNTDNSQLGAKLVVDFSGGFYVCGDGLDVWYKVNSGDGPSDCSPIELYTVAVLA